MAVHSYAIVNAMRSVTWTPSLRWRRQSESAIGGTNGGAKDKAMQQGNINGRAIIALSLVQRKDGEVGGAISHRRCNSLVRSQLILWTEVLTVQGTWNPSSNRVAGVSTDISGNPNSVSICWWHKDSLSFDVLNSFADYHTLWIFFEQMLDPNFRKMSPDTVLSRPHLYFVYFNEQSMYYNTVGTWNLNAHK